MRAKDEETVLGTLKAPPRRRQLPFPVLFRWLAFCLPVGLYYLWSRQYRWSLLRKLLLSCIAIAMATVLWSGVARLFARPVPLLAYSGQPVLQRDIYPLVTDPQGIAYHLEGCIHAPEDALSITLEAASRRRIPADERCNPPRYRIGRR